MFSICLLRQRREFLLRSQEIERITCTSSSSLSFHTMHIYFTLTLFSFFLFFFFFLNPRFRNKIDFNFYKRLPVRHFLGIIKGCLPYLQKVRKFRLECKWRLIWKMFACSKRRIVQCLYAFVQ